MCACYFDAHFWRVEYSNTLIVNTHIFRWTNSKLCFETDGPQARKHWSDKTESNSSQYSHYFPPIFQYGKKIVLFPCAFIHLLLELANCTMSFFTTKSWQFFVECGYNGTISWLFLKNAFFVPECSFLGRIWFLSIEKRWQICIWKR